MANFGFIIDNRRCIGCHACTVACKSEHRVPVGVNRTWVKYIEKGEFPNSRRLFSVMRCNHCDDAPCVEICPVTALYRRPDGIVDFDNRRCIGCKACMQACPYDALYIDPETSTAAKCNYCAHRIDRGLEPACVNVCPTQAIISGDLDDPDSRISRLKNREPVHARKTEKGTQPSLFYIDGDAASLDPEAAPVVDETMWSAQSTGVGHYAGHGDHALDRLGQLLSLGEPSEKLQPIDINSDAHHHGADDPGEARRAYDPPSKGVLWGWQVSLYLWTKAISTGAAMLLMLALLCGWANAGVTSHWIILGVSLVAMAVTGMLLVADLDRPMRFAYVLLRPQWRSWLVRGAYIITLFVGLVLVYLASFTWQWFPVVHPLLQAAILVAGAMGAAYTAFLFAQARGRDAWQSPLLPWHMINHALVAGAATLALTTHWLSFGWPRYLTIALALALTVQLLMTAFEMLIKHPSVAAEATARLIYRGPYAAWFWGGGLLVGTILPLALLTSLGQMALAPAAVASLLGLFVHQHVLVRAPQQIPLS